MRRQLGPAARLLHDAPTASPTSRRSASAGGYEKLVLYGTSYGTKLAEEYAQAYPEPRRSARARLGRAAERARPAQPRDLRRDTAHPAPAVRTARLRPHHLGSPPPISPCSLRRLGGRGRRASWIDGHGHGHGIDISSEALLGSSPRGRPRTDPARRTPGGGPRRGARRHGRARAPARAGEEQRRGSRKPGRGLRHAPLLTRRPAKSSPFPWSRAATPGGRLAEAKAQIHATRRPAHSRRSPQADVLALSATSRRARSGRSTATGPRRRTLRFPHVPTLILSGADDLRTPTANARRSRGADPGLGAAGRAQRGHSVLGEDPTSCSNDALQALFAGRADQALPEPHPPPAAAAPTPLPPARLADVRARAGQPTGSPDGRCMRPSLTLGDSVRQLAAAGPRDRRTDLRLILGRRDLERRRRRSALRLGGVRAPSKLVLHGYSYVPGVTVSGEITSEKSSSTVGGSAAAPGTLTANGGSSGRERTLTGLPGRP